MPLTLAGRVVAHLRVASDGPSMYLHVKLVDVSPDGSSHVLLYGQEWWIARAPARRLASISDTPATD